MSAPSILPDERIAEIFSEFSEMLDGLPINLPDGPGAASAFYMSLSLGDVVSMSREICNRRIDAGSRDASVLAENGRPYDRYDRLLDDLTEVQSRLATMDAAAHHEVVGRAIDAILFMARIIRSGQEAAVDLESGWHKPS